MSEPNGDIVDLGLLSPLSMDPDAYAGFCEAVHLPALPAGYGIALVLMRDGRKFTHVTPLDPAAGPSMAAAGWIPVGRCDSYRPRHGRHE